MIKHVLVSYFIILNFFVTQAFCSSQKDIDLSHVIDTRQLIGVIYFNDNQYKLTKKVKNEIDMLLVQALEKRGEHGIIRIEGFASSDDYKLNQIKTAFNRAKNVWNYLKLVHNVNNIYLTGFDNKQTISNNHGGRVEIVIYRDPFPSTESIARN